MTTQNILSKALATMLTLVPVTLLTTSCDKFLDIQPKGTMPKEVLFRDELSTSWGRCLCTIIPRMRIPISSGMTT